MYTFASLRRLIDEELRELERGLRCKVKYLGKVANEERWDYKIRKKELSKKDERIIADRGLEVLGEY